LKWSLTIITLIPLAACGLWLAGWFPTGDRSIVLSEPFVTVHGLTIENGDAYDRAVVELGSAKRIVLPDDAVVRRTGEPGVVRLFMKKTLGFHGHPPKPMSIRDARKNMGCAVKAEEDGLVVATYGEWLSKEGGTEMKILAVVPEGTKVDQEKDLSGMNSAGQEWHGKYLSKPKDAKGGHWYGPASPAEGWTAVPDVPDPNRTVEKEMDRK
jgi:hypothetical protein